MSAPRPPLDSPKRPREAAGFQHAARVQQNLTAAAEKRLLLWLAARTPRVINSDHLTLLGLVAQLGAGLSYAAARWSRWALIAASVCIFLNWLGDSLDGTLARYRQQQRPRYGFYVDHVIDTLGALFLMGGLALSGYTHPAVAIGMLVAFLMLSCETYLATYTLGEFHMSHGRFGPTEIRILLVIGNAALLRSPQAHLFGHRFLLFDLGGAAATVGMGAMFLMAAVRHTMQLYREEPLP